MTKKNETKKHKYNFIDFVLIIVALAIVAVGAYFIVKGVVPQTTESAITFTVEVHDVDNEAVNDIGIGDLISYLDTKTYLGTVKKITVTPEKVECVVNETVEALNEQGETVTSVEKKVKTVDSSLYSTVSITLTAVADTSVGIEVNGVQILSGETIAIYSRNFAGTGMITAIYNDTSNKEAK